MEDADGAIQPDEHALAAHCASLAPLVVGFVIASGYVMARTGDTGWPAAAITAVAVLLMLVTQFNPLRILAAAGVAGGLGLL